MPILDNSTYLCEKCQEYDQNYDPNIFPFSDVNEFDDLNNSTNITSYENAIDDVNIWEPFKKRGLHMIDKVKITSNTYVFVAFLQWLNVIIVKVIYTH